MAPLTLDIARFLLLSQKPVDQAGLRQIRSGGRVEYAMAP
jgi:hypothetical protein